MSDIYPTGAVDPYIRMALDRADVVREIYRRVANVQHPDEWHPVAVICPTCGKVGTTIVTKWDGERVFYECRPDLVTWARGCGASGWVSPFGGRAKLPWNLEWAAQWSLFGVTIEPCGKDLSTAGGSRDRSDAIAREVFEREPPLNVPYEFLNIGGRKMSTSKGRGAAAHRIVEVVPPEQLRLLFLRPRPNQRDRVRSGGHRRDPAPVRRVRQARRGHRRARGQGRAAGRLRVGLPLLALRPDRRRGGRGRRLPAELQPPRPARPGPPVDVGARVEAEKGSAADRARGGRSSRSASRPRGRWLDDVRAGAGPDRRPRDALPTEAADARARPAGVPRRSAPRRRARRARRRRRLAGAIFSTAAERRAAHRPRVRGHLPRVPRSDERTARRLAAGQPRPGLRARPAARGAAGDDGGDRMSVGLQRLREEPDRPPGRDRQGRGPDARRRGARRRRAPPRAPGRGRPAQGASATRRRRRSARRSAAGADPNGPEVAALRPRPTAAGERIAAIDAELADGRGRARGPPAAHPEPGRPRRAGRRRGRQRHGPRLGRAAAPGPAAGRRGRRRRARPAGRPGSGGRTGRSASGSASSTSRAAPRSPAPASRSTAGSGRPLQRALISWFLDVHTRENGFTEIWPPAVVNAASARGTGQIPDKEDQMYVVTRDELYLVPTAEVPVTNLHRDEILEAAELPIRYAAYTPVLPARGRRGRQGHPRHPPGPPVRQGRDGPVRATRGVVRGARVDDRPGRGPAPAPRPGLSGRSSWRPARWASSRPRSTTSRSGRPASSAGSRSARARTSATTRPAGWPSATGPSRAPSRSSSTRSTAPASPWPGSWPRSSRRTSGRTGRSRSPRCSDPISGAIPSRVPG